MAPSRFPTATPRAAMSWASSAAAAAVTAVTAVTLLAAIATPFRALTPRGAEAFVPQPAVPSSTSYSRATLHRVSFMKRGELGSAGERIGVREMRRIPCAKRGNGDGRVGAAPRMSMSEGEKVFEGDDEKSSELFPAIPANDVIGEAGVVPDDEEEDEDGVWSIAKVSRIVAERRADTFDPYAKVEPEPDPQEETFEEIVANMTKPLGITIESSTDRAEFVYITSVGEQAEDAGLRVGDVLTGVTGVFGPSIWGVKGESVERVRSLVRTRGDPYILLRVERGHVSLEERCSEGFDEEDDGKPCIKFPDEVTNPEEGLPNIWGDVYKEEADLVKRSNEKSRPKQGLFGGSNKKTNQGPPRKNSGLGGDGSGPFDGDSWDDFKLL